MFVSKPRLVRGKRWCIEYLQFDQVTQQERRRRREFDLNAIEDLTIRQAVAERMVKYLDEFIQYEEKPPPPPEALLRWSLPVRLASPSAAPNVPTSW